MVKFRQSLHELLFVGQRLQRPWNQAIHRDIIQFYLNPALPAKACYVFTMWLPQRSSGQWDLPLACKTLSNVALLMNPNFIELISCNDHSARGFQPRKICVIGQST